MKRIRKGFTLIELVVVTLIMAILASMSMPYYYKTVEISKATDAVAIGHLLISAYRIFQVDNQGVFLNGSITEGCNTGACDTASTDACRLVRCNYVAKQDRNNPSYTYTLNAVGVSVDRVDTSSPYDAWGYDFDMVGRCSSRPLPGPPNAAPTCPKF